MYTENDKTDVFSISLDEIMPAIPHIYCCSVFKIRVKSEVFLNRR